MNIPSSSPDFATPLKQAATAFYSKRGDGKSSQVKRPAPKALVLALLQAEKAVRQERQTYPLTSLLGSWQLYFSAPSKVHLHQDQASGKGFYFPQFAPAQISFRAAASSGGQDADPLEISNQVHAGPLLLRFNGPARYLSQKNLLSFNFQQIHFGLLGRTVYQGGFRGSKTQAERFDDQPISQLPFFRFFLITEDFIAARGRGGGLALWMRVSRHSR